MSSCSVRSSRKPGLTASDRDGAAVDGQGFYIFSAAEPGRDRDGPGNGVAPSMQVLHNCAPPAARELVAPDETRCAAYGLRNSARAEGRQGQGSESTEYMCSVADHAQSPY